ncbi:unnamed protein product [Paramecium primaurelia]|uniref:Uncharacterized protein n=2 Tax=Paramecium TaxID=5884 RepID=A0A8S1U7N5_9CILI|nr:unnamed protein product [Paramecium primaurelia]CAD8160738.1 unnamed protein product [Paramecium pentaurelia]
MKNSKKTNKFQIHRQQHQIHLQNVIYPETNNKPLCKLFENNNNQQTISKEVINKSKSIMACKKSLQLLSLILQQQSQRQLKKVNLNQPAVYKSLIIRRSLPAVKPSNQPIISCREKKSYSVQQSRRYSNSQNKINISMRETKLGPWEEE